MPHNFQRPGLPYANEALQNDNRYQIITRANQRPATDILLDTDFNYVIDGLRQLDIDIAGVEAGILPGSDDPANANFLPTTDGEGNISWVDISDDNVRDRSLSALKLIPQTITANEIMNGTIAAPQLATDAITEIKIVDGAVSRDKIGNAAINRTKIAIGAVGNLELDFNAVTTPKIADANVTTAKIADANVTLAKLAQEVLDRLVPIGTVVEFAGSNGFAANWLECNGQAISRETYATLFANLGTVYGVGDGATTFNLPDRRGRVAVGIGSDNGTGGRITAATAASITLGGTFGAETHTLNVSQIPPHSHDVGAEQETRSGVDFIGYTKIGDTRISSADTGGGLPHNNVQPSIFSRFYIRAL